MEPKRSIIKSRWVSILPSKGDGSKTYWLKILAGQMKTITVTGPLDKSKHMPLKILLND